MTISGSEDFVTFFELQYLTRKWQEEVEAHPEAGMYVDSVTLQVRTTEGEKRILSVSIWNGVVLYKSFFKKTILFTWYHNQSPAYLHELLVAWIDEPADDILNLFYEIINMRVYNQIAHMPWQ